MGDGPLQKEERQEGRRDPGHGWSSTGHCAKPTTPQDIIHWQNMCFATWDGDRMTNRTAQVSNFMLVCCDEVVPWLSCTISEKVPHLLNVQKFHTFIHTAGCKGHWHEKDGIFVRKEPRRGRCTQGHMFQSSGSLITAVMDLAVASFCRIQNHVVWDILVIQWTAKGAC